MIIFSFIQLFWVYILVIKTETNDGLESSSENQKSTSINEHLLERGKAIRRGKGNREGVTKIDEGSSRNEKGRYETH